MRFYLWHVIRRTSKKGKVFWLVRGVTRTSYENRMRNVTSADDGMYFAFEDVARNIARAMNIREGGKK